MIDIPSGRVAYAVLSFGGILRMGNKLFAVPWEVLTVDEDQKCFILNVDRATLENAPGFDKDNWPDMADPAWGTQIYSHYGRRPYWDTETLEGEPGRGTSRAPRVSDVNVMFRRSDSATRKWIQPSGPERAAVHHIARGGYRQSSAVTSASLMLLPCLPVSRPAKLLVLVF
jgi:hypothetical protein